MTDEKEPTEPAQIEFEKIMAMGILEKLHCVMSEVGAVKKQASEGLRYSFTSNNDVTAAIKPLLIKYRILMVPSEKECVVSGNTVKATIEVTFFNIDDREDHVSMNMTALGIDKQDKGPGKALTYVCKCLAMKLFQLESGDDLDADQGPEFDRKQNVFVDYDKNQGEVKQEVVPRRTAEPTMADAVTAPEENRDWRNVKVHFPGKYIKDYEERGVTDLRLGKLARNEVWFLAEKWELRAYQGKTSPKDVHLKKAAIAAWREFDNEKRDGEVQARTPQPQENPNESEAPQLELADDIPF